jgi:integrase
MGKRGNGEGSVYQRKSDGLWVGSVSLENGKRKVFYGKTKKEVTEKLITARHEQLQGVLVTAPAQTVKDYLEHWLEEVQKPTIRTSSYVKYRKVIYTYIIPAIGKVQLQKLTPQRVQSLYTSKLKEGLAPKTVQSIHGVLHKALDNAVKWNLIARNVCDVVSPPRVPQTEKQVLTVQQARLLLDHVKKHRLEVLLTVALTTGMRRGEILALRWSDINLEEGSLQVKRTVDYITHYGYVETEPKTARGRRKILLSSFVVEMLNAHCLAQMEERHKAGDKWIDKNLVFCGLLGDFFNPNYLLRVFKKILEDAGLPRMRFHDLRHSAATILLSMNVHPKVVQEMLGHSTINMTLDTYSHVLPSMQKDIVERWNDELKSSIEGKEER